MMCETADMVLVKNELWNKIQSKRKAKGLDELRLQDDPVKNPETKLTREEIERINLRRERNRVAARKSRDRRKRRCDALQKLVAQLAKEQKELEKEIRTLRTEKDELELMTNNHQCKHEIVRTRPREELTRETSTAKEKLQASIYSRREALGLDRIDISEEEIKITEPKNTYQNETGRDIRREQNKRSARRCRKRKREQDIQLRKEKNELMSGNEDLMQTIRELDEEKQRLESILLNHHCKMSPQPTDILQQNKPPTEFKNVNSADQTLIESRECDIEQETSQYEQKTDKFTACNFMDETSTELRDCNFVDETLAELADFQLNKIVPEFKDCGFAEKTSTELIDQCDFIGETFVELDLHYQPNKMSTKFKDCNSTKKTLTQLRDCNFINETLVKLADGQPNKISTEFKDCEFVEKTLTQLKDCEFIDETLAEFMDCDFVEETASKFRNFDCSDNSSTEYINCNFSDEKLSLLDLPYINLSFFQ